ncbi:Longitudinals lacking protein [Apis cerana cerana]|uniref:Longitudinals lacking protein n=1 Tax=Apis cerana cerana TaxID=94128 RepID=A0A2A3EQL7_APICC|nr:Longitudinals lacking protein [Apis cerana cerana]
MKVIATSYSCTILCYWANETPPRHSSLCNKFATSSSRVQSVAAFSIGRTTCRSISSMSAANCRDLEHLGGFKIPGSAVPRGTDFQDRNKGRFPCPRCTSIFNRKNNLYSHLKFECGQLPRFGCPYCDYASKKSSNIRAHVRRKHYGYNCVSNRQISATRPPSEEGVQIFRNRPCPHTA